MLTRMFAYFTLFCYLMMGTFIVRLVAPETYSFKFDKNYFTLNTTEIHLKETLGENTVAELNEEFSFSPITSLRPVEKKVQKRIAAVKKVPKVASAKISEKRYLPFYEPVSLSPIYFENQVYENLVSHYVDFNFEEKPVIAQTEVIDSVSTAQAAIDIDEEPIFFEYSEETEVKAAQDTSGPRKEEVIAVAVSDVETKKTEPIMKEEESSRADEVPSLVAFDYTQVKEDIKNNKTPKVSSHKKSKSSSKSPSKSLELGENSKSLNALTTQTSEYPVSLKIIVSGFDLKKTYDLENFELRFQDDLAEIREDFGSGEINYETLTTQESTTRTATVIKRGFAPTTADLNLMAGADITEIPLMEQEILNNLNSKYERSGPVGAVLVKLHDTTEVAKLDVPFGHVLTLDKNLKITKSDDYLYQLFVGTQAGNALVTYEKMSGEKIHKIIHVHENELTYEKNFYEEVKHKRVKLYEQNLLSKVPVPLVIGEEQVRSFINQKSSHKKNSNTYEISEVFTNLGGRQYLELSHSQEPVFVGYRENEKLVIPSENFMRFILSSVETSSLVNRCVIQVNLKNNTSRYEIGTESVDSAIRIESQVLDADGMFYSSLSEKSEKLIIVGEIANKENMSADGKINIKLEYENGSTEFISSYCSPNTYLVEQL